VKNAFLLALALTALAVIGFLCLRGGEAAPSSAASSRPSAATESREPAPFELAPLPAPVPEEHARESAESPTAKSDLPLLRDLAARPSSSSVEDSYFARKYAAMSAAERQSARAALERDLGTTGKRNAEEAAAVAREIAWLDAHPGS
jgi:hypothetical protein